MVAQIDRMYAYTRPAKVLGRLIGYALFEGRPLTTKGRWFNAIVLPFLSLLKRIPCPRRVKSPIFIVGTGRSGTTILGSVLSIHKRVGFLNEPKALWHSAVKCEDLIGSYSKRPGRYRLDRSDAVARVNMAMHRLYGWYSAATLSRRVVDKYPELIFRAPFVRELFPDAKFLFLYRNGWDTCRSITKWSERLGRREGGAVHDWWGLNNRKWRLLVEQLVVDDPELADHVDEIGALSNHADMAAVEWIVAMREGLRISREYPAAVHAVCYEELVKEPRKVLMEISDFCELGPDPVLMEYGEKVLRSEGSPVPFALHRAIEHAFRRTMRDLGYSELASES